MEIQKFPSDLAVVRLVTLNMKGQTPRLLFTTVTLLTSDRIPPPEMTRSKLQTINDEYRVYFKRVVMTKDAAIQWYLSLREGMAFTPVPADEASHSIEDNRPLALSKLFDERAWPNFSLPIGENLFSQPSALNHPAPFMGNQSGRIHRKFATFETPEVFLMDDDAVKFVELHMHVDLREYQEYLGGAAFVSPDPLFRYIENFMVPEQGSKTERVIYRFIPRAGQTVAGVEITTFDMDTNLLTDFQTHVLKEDGLLDLEKGICDGQYGFIARHPDYGILAYAPPSGFIRRVGMKMGVLSGQRRLVSVPTGDSRRAKTLTYPATEHVEYSDSLIGDPVTESEEFRIKRRSHYYRRQQKNEVAKFKQHWFEEGSREEAIRFFQGLMKQAQERVLIADPYFQDIQLAQYLYAVHPYTVPVTILSTKRAFIDQSRVENIKRFRLGIAQLKEKQNVEVLTYLLPPNCLHDRFIVIDDNVWLSGNSLNSVGFQSSMVVRLPEPEGVIRKLTALIDKGIPLESILDDEIELGGEIEGEADV
ncbi:hypothetical protein D3C79_367860 [compost metagenome]